MPRAGWYVTLGLVFGMLAFMRSNAYRRRTGNSPWHIHPLVWGIVSVFVTFLVTLLSIVFVAIFGTVLSIYAWSPRSQPVRQPQEVPTASSLPGISLAAGPASGAGGDGAAGLAGRPDGSPRAALLRRVGLDRARGGRRGHLERSFLRARIAEGPLRSVGTGAVFRELGIRL